jgi:hypothetical protein
MELIDSDYIHFIESQITVTVEPWYKKVDRREADRKVKIWEKVLLITGKDLKAFNIDISDKNTVDFFSIKKAEIVRSILRKKNLPEDSALHYIIIECMLDKKTYEAYISR